MAGMSWRLAGVCFYLCTAALGQTLAPVKVAPVQTGPIAEVVEGHGIIAPAPKGEREIHAAEPLRIEEVLVRAGDQVHKGQLLVRLQRDHSTELEVEKARISLEQARLSLARAEKLFKGGVIPRASLEQAQAECQLAAADFELQTRSLQYAVGNSELRAPITGVVSSVSGVLGQIADPAQPILHLVSGGQMVAGIGVELEDLAKIRAGQPATISVPSLPDTQLFAGTVERYEREADPETQLVRIWIPLDNQAGLLLPGMFAMARISVQIEPQALLVPKTAVLQDDEGAYVFVVEEGKAHRAAVQTGIRDQFQVQITEGLAPGQQVVCEGNYELEEDMPVEIQQER